MDYEITKLQGTSQPTAVIRDRAAVSGFSKIVPQHCGEVWNFIRDQKISAPGNMFALYHFTPGINPPDPNPVLDLEVGALVSQAFPSTNRVLCSSTPTGTLLKTVHVGPYQNLGKAHDAVSAWARRNGLTLAGVCWEIYGHWTDDPTQLTTEVCYLLK